MGKIEVKLREDYKGEFITTIIGNVIKKDCWTEVEEDQPEVAQLLRNGNSLMVKGIETLQEKVILDDVPKNTIKEVAVKEVMAENEAVIEKLKGEPKNDELELEDSTNNA